jgi:pimeloyl-ACP methyl ester carboxylesterase
MFNGRRQPSCDGTSRMTRECQVRICERLGVKFPGPTRHLLGHGVRFGVVTDVVAAGEAELAKHFTVHAFDYPGHGWSDIPNAAYAPEDFYQWTAAYLDKVDIRQAALLPSS